MAKAENKTQATGADVAAFLEAVPDPVRRADGIALDAMMRRVTGEEPRMWGPTIVGYGEYRYRYDSGREGEMCRTGFSPRKAELVVYLVGQFEIHAAEAAALFARLGKHRTGKSCLYIKRLADVDTGALEELVALNWREMAARYPL